MNHKEMENKSTPQDQGSMAPKTEAKLEQTDPNLTELKGFTDPNEKLEPKDEEIDSDLKNG